MKILSIALFNNPKGQGGIETFNRNLEKIFKDDIKIVTWTHKYIFLHNVVNLLELGSNNFFFRFFNKLFKNKIRENLLKITVKKLKPKNMIFSYPYEVAILRDIKAKKILVQHTSASEYMRVYCHNTKKLKILQESLDYFIVLSENDRKLFGRLLKLDERKLRVIRHTSTIELLETKKNKNKKLIMIARLDNESKRLDLAIKAMKKLVDFELEIYGVGPDENYYSSLIQREMINNVYMRGKTSKVQEKLDESGIFVITSDYEGYPITSIEAMRRGLPIVLRNTFGAASDIVVDDQNGILLEKEWNEDKFIESVRKIYDNYEYYSENAKKLGRRYDMEIIKKEWNNILGEA